jgi:hypothetical protein
MQSGENSNIQKILKWEIAKFLLQACGRVFTPINGGHSDVDFGLKSMVLFIYFEYKK